MARAKRTARADARRRHRAEQGLVDSAVTAEGDAPEPAGPRPDRGAAAGRRPGGAERVPIGTAFRMAFRPLDVRGDLAAFPGIALRTKALWVPILLTIVSAIVYVVVQPEGSTDITAILTVFLFQYFLQTPAIGGVFIAGFLAPRASWLLGIVVGLVSALAYSLLGLTGYIGVAAGARIEDVVVAAFALSPIMGAIFASAAAWYRRFLKLSNPNRGRPAQPARADGKTRNRPGNQKAGARR